MKRTLQGTRLGPDPTEPLCKCGHGPSSHYSSRSQKDPCHHLGAHDMRCTCRNYTPTPSDPKGWFGFGKEGQS